jgi:hypothetical protein
MPLYSYPPPPILPPPVVLFDYVGEGKGGEGEEDQEWGEKRIEC